VAWALISCRRRIDFAQFNRLRTTLRFSIGAKEDFVDDKLFTQSSNNTFSMSLVAVIA
jgi:hypothetical protein